MIEQEWLECTDPTPMLRFLESRCRLRLSDEVNGEIPELLRSEPASRKVWLFCCACARRADSMASFQNDLPLSLVAERRNGIDATEGYLDGQLSEERWEDASVAHLDAHYDHVSTVVAHLFYGWASSFEAAVDTADTIAREHWTHPRYENYEDYLHQFSIEEQATKRIAEKENRQVLSVLVRDIFGNPFRSIAIDPSCLAWNDGTVRRIAQSIYDERVFDRMPILADALTDAGCDNADILNHCRSEGPHVKGCWVVDLVLGKE